MPATGFAQLADAARIKPFRRLSDEDVVNMAARLLRDPRAWAAADLAPLSQDEAKDAARRAIRMLRDGLATV